jgi:oligopeptide transport system permease protein
MMRIVDILYGLPFMFLVILIVMIAGRSMVNLFIALGAVQWLTTARIVRGQVMSIKERDFVEAARALGARTPALVFRHIVPNLLGVVIVYATLNVPAIMLQEAFLSFLGLGVEHPMPSWGNLIAEGARSMEVCPWLMVFPGVAFSLTLLSLNFLGDGLRDALDPQART